MLAMPVAGRLTDKTGVGRIVPVGLVLVALSFLALTQLGADTSYVWFGVVLWVMGLGMGATMMPTFSGAMQTLRQSDVARASTTLNIQQQVGASIGTAVMSVLLTHEIIGQLGAKAGAGGIGAAATAVPPGQRAALMEKLATAFGHTYWYALALVILAFVVATPLLPKERPPAPAAEPGAEGEPEPAPVLMH
jgi:MFS family permease